MQQLFSKETFIDTAMGLRSGEDGIAGRKLEQDAWLVRKQHSKAGCLSDSLGPSLRSSPSSSIPPKLEQEVYHLFP